jgi:hypothetical protein
MTPIKEPQFFADFLGEHRRICNWADYLNCFAGADLEKRVGEASVAYLAAPNAAKDIKAFSPEARIIIMLRNPVDVMNSIYHLRRFSNLENEPSVESALAADQHRRRPYELTYREWVKFPEQVKRFIDIFGRDKVHIIIFDDFKADTASVYQDTLEFLDVRSDCRTSFPVVNANPRARSKVLLNAVRHPPQLLRFIIRPLTSKRARSYLGRVLIRLNVVYEKRPPIDPDLKSRLNIEFVPEVEQLSGVIGHDLSDWCKT